ncbi:UNVERIFIED_CONTAM: hypothetical protein GTU68_008521 [Idotea baltica]|nr:hypothetical protein [Idotea baltica]
MTKLPRRVDCLPASFFARSTEIVAKTLIGHAIVHRHDDTWIGGQIVETEAYLADGDLASHSSRGRTKSNNSMFESAGTLYVYPIHAKVCMNVVTEEIDHGAAVLIRAIRPIWGIEQMKLHRGYQDIRRLTRGPAMMCQALQVDRGHDGINLLSSKTFRIAKIAEKDDFTVDASPRIGISTAKEQLLRFTLRGSRFLSR